MVNMPRFAALTTFYVSALVISELMATKVIHIGWYIGPAGVIIYPFSFMLADVLAELYGGLMARRIVWIGFITLLVFVVATTLGTWLPSAGGPTTTGGHAYDVIFGFVPRIVGASLAAYVVGETLNVTIMAKLRQRRWFGLRTVLATSVGQLLDSTIFITIAFLGLLPTPLVLRMVITQYVAKVLIEAAIGTPLAYAFVRWVRRSGAQSSEPLAS